MGAESSLSRWGPVQNLGSDWHLHGSQKMLSEVDLNSVLAASQMNCPGTAGILDPERGKVRVAHEMESVCHSNSLPKGGTGLWACPCTVVGQGGKGQLGES